MVLILGGNGFLGYNLVKRFAKREKIRVFDRAWKYETDNDNIELKTGDFQEADFEKLLDGIETVFHFISSSVPYDGTVGVIENIQMDLLPTVRLLNAMKSKMVKKIVFISSGGTVYGECQKASGENDRLSPECVYAAQKVWIETCLHLYEKYDDIQGYILRIGNPYGIEINKKKRQGIIPIFTEKIMKGEPIEIWGTGENRRDYIYIDEVIDAIEAVCSYNGKSRIFNIGTGTNYSIKEIIERIEHEVGKKAQLVYKEKRQCDLEESLLDVSLIYRECGWKSTVRVDQGIKMYIDHLMSAGKTAL